MTDAFRDPNDTHLPRGRSFRAWRVDLPDGRMLIARGLHNFTEGPPPGFYYLFLVAIAIGIAAFPFVRRITGRLERLRGAVETWGEGHLDTRIPERGHDEIASVARSFNLGGRPDRGAHCGASHAARQRDEPRVALPARPAAGCGWRWKSTARSRPMTCVVRSRRTSANSINWSRKSCWRAGSTTSGSLSSARRSICLALQRKKPPASMRR